MEALPESPASPPASFGTRFHISCTYTHPASRSRASLRKSWPNPCQLDKLTYSPPGENGLMSHHVITVKTNIKITEHGSISQAATQNGPVQLPRLQHSNLLRFDTCYQRLLLQGMRCAGIRVHV